MERKLSKLVLETGEVFEGISFGANVERVCEVVINTSVVGYQEIVTDLTNYKQAVVMTYPVIGNYGITDEDNESKSACIGALIVRDYNDLPSNFRCTKTLAEILEDSEIPAIYGVDTRRLTKVLLKGGERKGIITDISTPVEECIEKIKNTHVSNVSASMVSCRKKWFSRTEHAKYNVVAIDCGIKFSLVKALTKRGCNVTVLPYNASAEEVERLSPDCLIISNGPGSPEGATETISLIKNLKGKYPIIGVGLGMQLIVLAYGGKVKRMPFGHRGSNHSIRCLADGSLETVYQNHGYVAVKTSVKKAGLEITHENVLDGSVEGVADKKNNIYGVQYHSENCADQNASYLFSTLVRLMEENKNA